MARRKRRPSIPIVSRGSELMLAPAVMAMRMPLMLAELGHAGHWPAESARAVSEKMVAGFEGMVAAQFSLMESATTAWTSMMLGRSVPMFDQSIYEKAWSASLKPSMTAVNANFKRLSSRKL